MKPEREFYDVRKIPVEAVEGQPGMTQRVLSRDDQNGDCTRLLYFPPGHESQGVQVHDFWEEVYIVSGSMHDITIDRSFTAGMYACRPPGMRHGPWRTPEGAVTFEVRYVSSTALRSESEVSPPHLL